MLTKIRSSKVAKARMLMVLPIVMVLLVVFACNEATQNELKPEIKTYVDANGNTIENEVFYEVDDMPAFPGGNLELRKHIAINVAYPKLAKETGTEGRIFIQFVVNEEGKVEQVEYVGKRPVENKKNDIEEVTVVGSSAQSGDKEAAYEELINEAIRVVGSLPDWKPGMQDGKYVNVSFTVPINFQLN